MAAGKEIRNKIKSVENTKKITKAMEMVAASKMRKAQERMRAARPYASKLRNISAHLAGANPEYVHPYMVEHDGAKAVGFIVVTTDKGLCGGLNTNILRNVIARMREAHTQGLEPRAVALGSKGLGFMHRSGIKVVAQAVQLGDRPHMDRLIGPLKVLLDGYIAGELRAIYICYTGFVNTMRQEPTVEALLPLSAARFAQTADEKRAHAWDYLYEPDAKTVVDDFLKRYVETLVYQAVAENMASEQSARMVAMKSATDNAGNVIGELKLIYNKTRQAAITKELSEIVAGAAAV